MLNNATCFDRVILVCGYTDLRCGIDGLISALKSGHDISPFQEKVLFYSYVMPLEEAKNFYLAALNKPGTVNAE